MARTKIVLFKSNIRRDGSCPVCLRVAKEDKTKYIDLQLSATKGQWDELASRFKKDKRVNPNYENYNALLNRYEVRKDEILQKFMEERVNWTLNQFEEEFLGMSKQGKVYDYFMRQVENLKATRHIGNAKVYERTLHMLAKYDDKIEERLFSELDVKYINRFNLEMEKDGCCGNTRKYYLKTLRAVINKAIKEREASSNTYPFGKGGFDAFRYGIRCGNHCDSSGSDRALEFLQSFLPKGLCLQFFSSFRVLLVCKVEPEKSLLHFFSSCIFSHSCPRTCTIIRLFR